MNSMKIFALIIISFFLFTTAANAQVEREVKPSQNSTSGATTKNRNKELFKELNLTRHQKEQLKDFRQSTKQKRDSITNDQSLIETQRQAKLKELRMEQKEKLNSVLTPEQMRKLRDLKMNVKIEDDVN